MGLRAVIVDDHDDVLVFSEVEPYKDLSLSRVRHLSVVGSKWVWFERAPPEHNPPSPGKIKFPFPVQLQSYVFFTPLVVEGALATPPAYRYYANVIDQMSETMFSTYTFGCDSGEQIRIRNQTLYNLWHRHIFLLLLDAYANGVTLKNLFHIGTNPTQYFMTCMALRLKNKHLVAVF